jgi:hypothetical protein
VHVIVRQGGPVVITTSAAEFDVLPSGYVRACLTRDGQRMTLDEPDAATSQESVTINVNLIYNFRFDSEQVRICRCTEELGSRAGVWRLLGRKHGQHLDA